MTDSKYKEALEFARRFVSYVDHPDDYRNEKILGHALLSMHEELVDYKAKVDSPYSYHFALSKELEKAQSRLTQTEARLVDAEEVIGFTIDKTHTDPAGDVELRARAACIYKENTAYFQRHATRERG